MFSYVKLSHFVAELCNLLMLNLLFSYHSSHIQSIKCEPDCYLFISFIIISFWFGLSVLVTESATRVNEESDKAVKVLFLCWSSLFAK